MKTIPMFPSTTEWVPPQTFPNLSEAKEIAIDLETCDPNMESYGPGWPRGDGFIVGYAVAVDGWLALAFAQARSPRSQWR